MEINTGATKSITSKMTFDSLWPSSNAPPLKITVTRLRTYTGGTIKVIGEVVVEVRTVLFAFPGKVEQEIIRLQEQGVIEPVRFADWIAPVAPVIKSDGVRLCGDHKATLIKLQSILSLYLCESSDSAFNLSIESSVHESTSLKCEHNLNKIDMGIKMKPFHLCLNRVIISAKKNRRNPYSKMELRKAHPRSIFRNQNDENIFKDVFSDLISRVASKVNVSKSDILERAHTCHQFSPILSVLYESYPEHTVNTKMIKKVRTLGIPSCKKIIDKVHTVSRS
ncbi:E3 ubiquitin-protein ligase [Oopsacas minuta]|uniref:E3 ubiquitin-protein ligase n=1 Tax=Oopsacas minuta TaxID=111878 RepID=A0AAV7KE66_9METZ|nr:E3 ubiquitin-protein ligase [Oopsacas minuta]